MQFGATHYRSMDGNKIIAFALDKYYEVMLRRQNTCCARGSMQMRSELCCPIRSLLILGSTVRVPWGFAT